MEKRRFWNRFIKILGIVFVLMVLVVLFIPPVLYFGYRRYVYVSPTAISGESLTVIVFGAGVEGDTPSGALRDRLDTAIKMFETGKVATIVVSGARTSEYYDEPKVMKSALVEAGIPEDSVIEDSFGMRTYDTCRRAREEYDISDAILVSQGFHLPRALFLCRNVGINATGVYATGSFSTYYDRWYTIREVLAMYKAVWDVVNYRL